MDKMIRKGLQDSHEGKTLSNIEMKKCTLWSLSYPHHIKSETAIDILGIFHGTLDIEHYLVQ